MKVILLLSALLGSGFGRVLFTPPSKEVLDMFRANQESYVFGGEDADENEWPWQGYLLSFGSFTCGLTVISDEWVLTAAHCIFGANPQELYSVGLGCIDRSGGTCQEFDVDEVIEHPDFNWDPATGDDVGVMHLTTTLEFSESIQPITISQETDISVWADATGCYITGFGRPMADEPPSNILQEANIGIYTIPECEALWSEEEINDEEHVCIGTPNEAGTCSGDSGGPTVCPDGNGGYVQIGISSWSSGTCDATFPSIYTNAALFN